MSCPDYEKQVEEYLDGLLAPDVTASLRDHAAACGECAAELSAAGRFRELLAGSGRAALQAEAVRRTAAAAALLGDDLPAAATSPRSARPSVAAAAAPRGGMWRRLAAAAAVAAALGTGYVLGRGGDASPANADLSAQTAYARGAVRTVAEGRSFLIDEDAVLAAEASGEVVNLASGAALFQVEKGKPFAVVTPEGTARVLGTCFHVRVGPDRGVSVSVLSGVVRFEPKGANPRQTLRPGSTLEVAPGGAQRVVTSAQFGELEMRLSMQSLEIDALRGEIAKRDEELAAARIALPRPVRDPQVPADAFEKLPWREIGTKFRAMIAAREGKPSDPKVLEALGVFFANAETFTKATGSRRPWEWPLHPAVLERVAPSFYAALSPDADPAAVQAVTDATVTAARDTQARIASGLVPAEAIRERLVLVRTIVASTQQHLGDAAAAEIARFLTPERDGAYVRVITDGETSAKDIAALWAREFDMSDAQRDAVLQLTVAFLDEVAAAQDRVVERLGDEEAWQTFAPFEKHGRKRPPGAESDAVAIETTLARIDAKLEVAAPRIAFERGVRDLLRPEQREHAMPAWGLVVLRHPDAAPNAE